MYTGKLITSVVTGIAHRRPQGESYDQAIRNDETGLWQCPFCQQDNFPELSEVRDIFFYTFFSVSPCPFILLSCNIILMCLKMFTGTVGCPSVQPFNKRKNSPNIFIFTIICMNWFLFVRETYQLGLC